MNLKKAMCFSMFVIAFGIAAVGCANNNNATVPSTIAVTPGAGQSELTYDQVLSQLQEIDRQQEELDRQEDELKAKYRNGEITREDYIAQIADVDNKKIELDRQEDELEEQLESLRNSGATSATTNPTETTTAAPTTATTSTPTTAAPSSGNNTERDKILQELIALDVKDEELDLQEDQLEYQYRTGQIDRNTFTSKMADIERQELEIDAKQNELELQLFNLQIGTQTSAPAATSAQNSGGNFSSLIENERQQNAVDLQEDQLELQYRQGQISWEEFRNKMAELEAREEALDYEEDMLEGDWD